MADRFPLILNTSANQIQEIASGDTLDLTDVNISNAGVITATSFAGDGSGLIGVASTDNIVTGTAATFNNTVDINSDLDVDGHTNLDNVSIAGVTTFSGIIEGIAGENKIPALYADLASLPSASTYHGMFAHVHATGRGYFSHAGNWLELVNKETSGNVGLSGDLDVDGHTNLDNVSVAGFTTITQDLDVDGHTNLDNVSIAGVVTTTSVQASSFIGGSFSGSTGTFSGNVSIGGTLTYEDVTNIDSVGLVTAREGVFLPDDKQLKIGNTAGSPDLKIYHSSGINYLDASNGHFALRGTGNDNILYYTSNGDVEIYDNGNKKLETSSSGVTITGTLTATSFSGDGSGLTNIGVSTEQVTPSSNVATLDLSKDDHKIVASGTYTIDVSGGNEAESHVIRIENSGISTVGFSTYFKFPSGGTPALPTASGAISLISFTVHKVGSVGIATVLLAGASVNFS